MTQRRPSTAAIWAAMAAIYLFWGSTYLGIKLAIESMPPFLMAGVRFAVAGVILYGFAKLRGAGGATWREWGATAALGVLLLGIGNGAVVWAEQWVPSGLVAVVVGSSPIWMVAIERVFWKVSVSRFQIAGVAVGVVGIAVLVNPSTTGAPLLPLAVLLLSSISWAAGTVYGRHARLPASSSLANGMELFAAAVVLAGFGLVTGEASHVHPAQITLRSLLGLGWLIVFGSLVGFSCYLWLIRVAPVVLVSTQAYISPVVALALGALVAGERVTGRELVATGVIVVAVGLIATAPMLARRREARELERVASARPTTTSSSAPPPPAACSPHA
jgi:drug/metabolite transporter (DMT)-like permease